MQITLSNICLVALLAACSLACGEDPAAVDDGVGDGASAADSNSGDSTVAGDIAADQVAIVVDAAPDAGELDAPAIDTHASDVSAPDAAGDAGADDLGVEAGAADSAPLDVPPAKVCTAAETKCLGVKLGTCGPYEDGWIESFCNPGMACETTDGKAKCVPLSNNLIIAFDTSGSMLKKVPNCSKGIDSWPTCNPNMGCSRMDASKVNFAKALATIDETLTRMAMFRFPQHYKPDLPDPNCATGFYKGQDKLSGESIPGPENAQHVDPPPASPWFWQSLDETLCVPFPGAVTKTSKAAMLTWMNGTGGKNDPELRATGGTPIGKTLFYLGEYLRNRVVIQGRACTTDAACDNPHYRCVQDGKSCATAADGCTSGKCVDPARNCRETTVVLFTDGEQDQTDTFFGPWTQAKRLGFGLGCQSDADCVGGAVCKPLNGASPAVSHCRRVTTVTDWYCNPTMKPCLPSAKSGDSIAPTACATPCPT